MPVPYEQELPVSSISRLWIAFFLSAFAADSVFAVTIDNFTDAFPPKSWGRIKSVYR